MNVRGFIMASFQSTAESARSGAGYGGKTVCELILAAQEYSRRRGHPSSPSASDVYGELKSMGKQIVCRERAQTGDMEFAYEPHLKELFGPMESDLEGWRYVKPTDFPADGWIGVPDYGWVNWIIPRVDPR